MQSPNRPSKRAAPSGAGWSPWESVSPDILALIFARLPTEDLLGPVPLVCRSWRDALSAPCCWADIDIEDWCRKLRDTERVDAAVRCLVARAAAMHRRVNAYRIGNPGFEVAVSSGRFLKVLQIIMGDVSDQMVVKHAASLTNLTKLDISYCLNISSEGIEVFGKHCKSLVYLRRTMPPADVDPYTGITIVDEGEAFAIASSMPRLEYLELAYALFSDQGLDAILRGCVALARLDIRGCWNVKMEGDLPRRCKSVRRFSDPWENDFGNFASDFWVNEEDENDDQAAFGGVDWTVVEAGMNGGSDVAGNADQAAAIGEPEWSDVDWSEIDSDDEQATVGEVDWSEIEEDTDEGDTVDNAIITDAENKDDQDAIEEVDWSEIGGDTDDELNLDEEEDNVGKHAPIIDLISSNGAGGD